MHITDNTILITGGGSGIGRGLAEAFHREGNKVIISGRDASKLTNATAANPGMEAVTLDVDDPADIRRFAAEVVEKFPSLNVVVNNAGIMRSEDVKTGETDVAEAEITTNLLGPIRLTAALMPTLLAQPKSTVMTVTSGLAFLPLAFTPTYCATKAAIHSYSESLRYQLRDTPVEVIELVPPYVQTELMGERQASDPQAMPLDDFIAEVMEILKSNPGVSEIVVKRCQMLRNAPKSENYDERFVGLNKAFASHAE